MSKNPLKKRIARAKATIAKKDDPTFSSAKKRVKAKPKKFQLKLKPLKQRVIKEEDKEREEKKEEKIQSQIDTAYQTELNKFEKEERRDDEKEKFRIIIRKNIKKRLEINKNVKKKERNI